MIISPREQIDLKGTIEVQCLEFRLSLSIILAVRRILSHILQSKEGLVVFLLI